MEKTQAYLEANKGKFLNELLDWLRIPSISNSMDYKDDVQKAAEFLREKLETAGVDKVEVCSTAGHPIVYAEKIIDPALPTVLVYGHYDVQPADPLDLWDSGPFDPVIKMTDIHPDGAIFARGSCDDKGQVYMHVAAFEAMVASGELPCNVKFMIEGEEEVGSENLGIFCKEYKDKIAADVIIISDTSIIARDVPSITVGLRGLCYMQVEVTGPNRDLHSGTYGGAVANPINVLCNIIDSLMDENKHITIPGFYDDVLTVSDEERRAMNEAPFDLEEYKKDLEINDIHGEAGYTSLERTTIRPTLDVNGIWGGYIGKGSKTVLPSKAFAKMSMRLVPNQDPEKIAELFTKHFEALAPDSVKVKVTPHHGGQPIVVPTDLVEYQATRMAMEETFGKTPIPMRSGGSIPIVALFKEVLGINSILMGFGFDSDSIHSPNEHYGLYNFYKGMETIPYFYRNYTELRTS